MASAEAKADADATDDTGSDQGPRGVGEGGPQGCEEEAGSANEEDLTAADLIGEEAGEADADDATDHDGGDHESLQAGGQVVRLTQEFDGTGDAHGVVTVQKSGHAGAQRQDDHVFH